MVIIKLILEIKIKRLSLWTSFSQHCFHHGRYCNEIYSQYTTCTWHSFCSIKESVNHCKPSQSYFRTLLKWYWATLKSIFMSAMLYTYIINIVSAGCIVLLIMWPENTKLKWRDVKLKTCIEYISIQTKSRI